MRTNKEVDPSDLRELRETLQTHMRNATAAVYDLEQPAWHGAFVDFPIVESETSYTVTAYWSDQDQGPRTRSADNADLIVATGAAGREEALRRRYGVGVGSSSDSLVDRTVILTRDGAEVKTTEFKQTPSGRIYAELIDTTTYVLLTSSRADMLPGEIRITSTGAYEHLISHWAAL